MSEQTSLRKRSSGAQLDEREQEALTLLSKAQAKQKEVETAEARMAEIAEQVDSGLNRDTERALLQEMSKLRRRKQELQKQAMAALETASRPSGTAGQPDTATKMMSRTQRAAAESTPGALLKGQSARGESGIDWCALVMVYVKAAAMFAFVFWLVRFQITLACFARM
jgi:predicted  nucleic acid-binding Zn-ribbon protein